MLYSNGLVRCVAVGGKRLTEVTSYGIEGRDFGGKDAALQRDGCCIVMGWHAVL